MKKSKFNSGKMMLLPALARTIAIFLLFIMVPVLKAFPQVIERDSLVFEQDSSILTGKMNDQLDRLCSKALKIKHGRIGLTVWQLVDRPSITGTTPAEKRMRRIFACLIEQNCGNLVHEIRIKPLKPDPTLMSGGVRLDQVIEFRILEPFPDDNEPENDTIWEMVRKVIPLKVIREPDTIIRGANGTLVRFRGMSMQPYKLSDFRYEIDEMFDIHAIGNNNMSTMTSAGVLIGSFKAVRIWAIPVNAGIPLQAALQIRATILIPIDSTKDDTATENMVAFRPGKGSKSFVTWSKSGDGLRVETYGGRRYFMLQTDAMGILAIGKLDQARAPVYVHIPSFRKMKITIASDSSNALAIFHDPDQRMIRLITDDLGSDGLKDYFVTAEGVDRSGNLYILEKKPFDRFANKSKKNCFEIRKKDFQKL